jgi:hypothetical protein
VDALRSRLEHERNAAKEASEKLEATWRKQLKAAREELQGLNARASTDTEASALRRSRLHIEIAARERGIRDNALERERARHTYDLELTKLWIAEHWPERRAGIHERIRKGEARDRPHGDVEDAGYRTIAKDVEKDIETGKQAVRQMGAGGWLPSEFRDEEVQVFVRRVAQQIAANSDLKVPLHVTVLDSSELKAIALPGGFLYITSGLVARTQSESELAAVLAREIARIAARHAVRSAKVSWVSRMFLPVTQIAGGIFAGGPANPAAYYGIGYGLEGLGGVVGRAFRTSNAELQAEADQLGIQYAWNAGYDPAGFLAFLDAIRGQEDEFLPEDPVFRERVLKLFDEIEYLPALKKTPPVSGDFDKVRRLATR